MTPPRRRTSVAAGAARASGERARRRATPLLEQPAGQADEAVAEGSPPAGPGGEGANQLAGPEPDGSAEGGAGPNGGGGRSGAPAVQDAPEPASRPVRKPRPTRSPRPPRVPRVPQGAAPRAGTPTPAAPVARAAGSTRAHPAGTAAAAPRLRVVGPEESAAASEPRGEASERADLASFIAAARAVAHLASGPLGLSREAAEAKVAEALAFVRRRLTGDYTVDDYGYDPHFAEHILFPLLRVLYTKWFRIEVRGIEHIPAEGGALIVGNHAGTVALDSLMTTLAIHDHHPNHRALRELGADLVFGAPFLGNIARKGGATLATNPDAERLLSAGELVGVWPEGFKGVGKPFSERYRLQRFGRGGFVGAAIRTGTPIVPCSIVGSEEIYPMIGNLKSLARVVGLPYLPVTPFFPHFGLLGLVPLPSKWIIEFGPPVHTDKLGAAAADDPMLVFDLTDRVRETIQQTLYSLLARRRSVFF